MRNAKRFLSSLLVLAVLTSASMAQGSKPMTNDDVISMVKNVLPESVIVSAIKTNDTNFDVSAAGLINLKKAGVSAKVMEAMLAAVGNRKSGPSPLASDSIAPATSMQSANVGVSNAAAGFVAGNPATSPGTPPVASQFTGGAPAAQPMVFFLQAGAKFNLPAEATQIVQTKSKANSLSALAEDQAVTEALRLGSQALQQAISNTGSTMGNSAVNSGTTIFSAILARKQSQKPNKVTYIWALQGASSASFSPANPPSFEVDYAGIPGINADAFEPVLVKLSVAQSTYRLVGATEASTTTEQTAHQDWPMYSSFMEDRVATSVQMLGPGQVRITPNSALPAGQYAVALRPRDKSHKFSGEQVGKNEGEGLLFNYAWSFSVK